MSLVYKKCPSCGSKNSAKIVYGMPSYELYEEIEQGKVVLGGCCIMEYAPQYFCKDCKYEWNKNEVIDNAYRSISNIKAYVGGYSGPNYEVELDFENKQLIWNGKGNLDETEESVIKTMDVDEYNNIIEELKIINLLNWKANYIDPGVLDGTQWSVEIQTDERMIRKSGSNRYPRTWNKFCSLIEKITGKAFG
jgi:hypothetical protein